jgi:hypothetical protein
MALLEPLVTVTCHRVDGVSHATIGIPCIEPRIKRHPPPALLNGSAFGSIQESFLDQIDPLGGRYENAEEEPSLWAYHQVPSS